MHILVSDIISDIRSLSLKASSSSGCISSVSSVASIHGGSWSLSVTWSSGCPDVHIPRYSGPDPGTRRRMRTVQCCRAGNGNPLGSQLSALGLIGARTQPAPVVNSIHWRFWPLWSLWPLGLHLHVFPQVLPIYLFLSMRLLQKLPCLTLLWPKWEQLTSQFRYVQRK